MNEFLMALLTLAGLGFGFGLILAWTSKKIHVETDPRVTMINELLPGANCGACGFAGCNAFAEALVLGQAEITACIACNTETRHRVALILGVSACPIADSKVAVIHCAGGEKSKDKFTYQGLADCWSAAAVLGGSKECAYACLGQGICIQACPFNAISVGESGALKVDPEKCRGCGKCMAACPRKLITLEKKGRIKTVYIACSSHDKGPVAMRKCKAACIACGKCVQTCPLQAISIKDNLAVIDYSKCVNCGKCVEVCPTKAIKSL